MVTALRWCRGIEVRLVAEIRVAGDLRVTSVSHALYRFAKKTKKRTPATPTAGTSGSAGDADGVDTKPTAMSFDLGTVRAYADVSGDHNPIHTSPMLARVFGFRGAISHGMFTLARCVPRATV